MNSEILKLPINELKYLIMYENPNILTEKDWLLYHNHNSNNNINNNSYNLNNLLIKTSATTTKLLGDVIDSTQLSSTIITNTTDDYNLTQQFDNNIINNNNNNNNNNYNYNYNNYDNITDNAPILLIAAETIGNLLSCYYTPILVFTGSIGNILSVFVFFKTKLRKLSSSYYLSALAISDTCFLIGLFIQWLNFIDIYLYNRQFLCQFFTFFSSLCSFLSVWFVVAFTVERFIAVMYPLKRQTMCTVKRAKIVLIGLTLLGTLHCLPLIYFASPRLDINTNSTICDIKLEFKDYMTIVNYVDTVVVFVVPFTAIVVLNTFTGCTVWKFATVRRKMTTHKRKQTKETTNRSDFPTTVYRAPTLKKQTSLISNCSHPNGKNSIRYSGTVKSGRRKMTNTSQLKVTKMLLIVSTVFICLNLPSYVMRVRAFLETNPTRTTIAVQYICWFLFLTNFGINFVIYCLSGQNFRRAVISIFRKPSSNQRDGVTQVTVISGSPSLKQSKFTASDILKEFIENYIKLPGFWQYTKTESATITTATTETATQPNYTQNINNSTLNLYKDQKIDGYIKLLQILKKINNENYMLNNVMKEINYYNNHDDLNSKLKLNMDMNMKRELTSIPCNKLNNNNNKSLNLTDCNPDLSVSNIENNDNDDIINSIGKNVNGQHISHPDLLNSSKEICENKCITENVELLPLQIEKLELKSLNEEEILIKAWESKLKRIPRMQRLLAENAINDILMKAEMCKLKELDSNDNNCHG